MEDNERKEDGPDNSNNHTSITKKKRRKSLITILIIFLILILIIFIVLKLVIRKDDLDLSQEAFLLSDNSTLLFVNEEDYILSYDILDQKIEMKGKYKLNYGENLNPNIEYEYSNYIQDFKEEDYILGFLELQNQELYINNIKSENGYVNTYYILMMYFDDKDNLILSGYNIDTGIRVEFEKQEGKFKEIYEQKSAI